MELGTEGINPPEELLTEPKFLKSSEDLEISQFQQTEDTSGSWLVVARNRRVNKDWEELLLRAPENSRRCYKDLCNAPMTRQPGIVFPLKGKLYKGAWEYEVTKSDRVFYIPNPQNGKIVVYYAGKHPKGKAPFPP